MDDVNPGSGSATLERWLTGPRFARAPGRGAGSAAAGAVVRVLPAEDRGAGAAALGLHSPAGAAAAALRLGDIRRGRSTRQRTHATVARIVQETGWCRRRT